MLLKLRRKQKDLENQKTNNMQLSKLFNWRAAEQVLRVVEVFAIVAAALVVLQLPRQLEVWENEKQNRSFDILFRLEDRLLTKNNQGIYYALKENKNVLQGDKGNFKEDELDQYLNDLSSIGDAYYKDIVDEESLSNWFSGYFDVTCDNQEISKYFSKVRKENSSYYGNFEQFCKDLSTLPN